MAARRKSGSTNTVIEGKNLTLERWIAAIHSDSWRRVLPNNCFPTNDLRQEYIHKIDTYSEDEIKRLLRRFLIFSGTYGIDNLTFQWLKSDSDAKNLILRHEFLRRFFTRRPWEGNTWVLDLLPDRAADAVQVLDTYWTAHAQWFADNMLYGQLDAIAVIQARYKLDALHSTLISYGESDEKFATRLHRSLTEHGVKVFFSPRTLYLARSSIEPCRRRSMSMIV